MISMQAEYSSMKTLQVLWMMGKLKEQVHERKPLTWKLWNAVLYHAEHGK